MAEFTQDALSFARGLARWFLRHHWITVHEYRAISDKIARRETSVFGCEGKAGFQTHGLAAKVVKRARNARGGHKRSTIYRCHTCHLFHIAIIEHTRAVRLRDDKRRERLAVDGEDFVDA